MSDAFSQEHMKMSTFTYSVASTHYDRYNSSQYLEC